MASEVGTSSPTGGRSTLTRPAESIEVSISDKGPGIDEADRAQLFEPFYRGRAAVERQVQGSGLGLSLVAAVARLHGGSIRLEDNTPGLRAVLTLPLRKAAALRIDASATAS